MTRIRSVFLVGFMGVGKTSVGQELARRLGWRFLDLDDLIVAREGRAIAEIFRDSGETAFRQAESRALGELLATGLRQATVVALGGGAFAQEENARLLRQASVPVVFLDAPLQELRRRCAPEAGNRPLFQDENQFRQLYEARLHAYMKADLRIQTSGLTVEQVAAELARRLGLERAPKSGICP